MIERSMHIKTGISSLVFEELNALAKKYDLQRLILFGSRSRGDKVRFALDADELTSTLLTFDFVDLDKEL